MVNYQSHSSLNHFRHIIQNKVSFQSHYPYSYVSFIFLTMNKNKLKCCYVHIKSMQQFYYCFQVKFCNKVSLILNYPLLATIPSISDVFHHMRLVQTEKCVNDMNFKTISFSQLFFTRFTFLNSLNRKITCIRVEGQITFSTLVDFVQYRNDHNYNT